MSRKDGNEVAGGYQIWNCSYWGSVQPQRNAGDNEDSEILLERSKLMSEWIKLGLISLACLAALDKASTCEGVSADIGHTVDIDL